nr:MAG TPA: hypothetical protein [Caudoviricetes sp.]
MTISEIMKHNYRLTLYAVQIYGVRLADFHEPRPVEILCDSEEKRNQIRKRAKNGTLYDEFNCYYISEEEARRSIKWALFILNIMHLNNEER